ncbi:hypothetical protein FNO01nite_04740 [Flavobacterium noncentrifugens]|uniref:Uncharacterized protein n=1 Tax=Flavobacterium noncentrifugens TaxID=1128970 RepID=A0A1G8SEK4_9FLAO|nr:hypothetical protein [Flavobacterium noncentrifugens]GEP49802.1 hypothetical protein FNO01nite_04740 [Flavobacterium noncentrifugens]SDJ27638.1 hypothetical protein SAMN04487935_0524 [Flavobacterium noncentrifugens]
MKKLLIVVFFLSAATGFSQRFDILSGQLKNLKGITEFNVTFDYKDLKVHGYDTEEAYLQDKMKKREEKGTDETFKAAWYADRGSKYEPKFIEYFNKKFDNGEIKVAKNPEAKYTMNIKTLWIYPGYSVVAAAEPAKITAIVTISETANPSNILVSIEFDKSIGIEQGQFDFDQGYRIAGAYEKLAKNLSMQLKRFL